MKVLVFTNYDSLRTLHKDVLSTDVENGRGQVTPNALGLLLSENKLVCRDNTSWKEYNLTADNITSNFILIRDDISFADFESLYNQVKEKEHCVLFHRQPFERDPADENFNLYKTNRNWKKGSHTENSIYQTIAGTIAIAAEKTDTDLANEIDKQLSILQDRNDRLKTDFLYHIYNGNTPTEFPKEITPTEEIINLHQYFNSNAYNKQLDLDADETKGAEQRQKLSLLRDALLANK